MLIGVVSNVPRLKDCDAKELKSLGNDSFGGIPTMQV
jgi:hypothetical protein